MYIWTGIIVEGQLDEVKAEAIKAEEKLNLPPLFGFPMHVSVKISFFVPNDKTNEVVDFLSEYFSSLKPFSVPVKAIELEDTIVWVRMKECDELKKIQSDMNRLLGEKFGVPVHEYDTDFKFHSTLCMADEGTAKAFYAVVKNAHVPSVLKAKKAGIAISEEWKPFGFKIIKTIDFSGE